MIKILAEQDLNFSRLSLKSSLAGLEIGKDIEVATSALELLKMPTHSAQIFYEGK